MIKKTKTRSHFVIDNALYIEAKEKAKQENRSFSNYVCNLIKKDLKGDFKNEK